MKYFSDKTNKFYDSEKDCIAAEKAFEEEKKRKAEERQRLDSSRKERAKEVDNARKNAVEAMENYQKTLDNFLKDYRIYHWSTTDGKDILNPFSFVFKFLDI